MFEIYNKCLRTKIALKLLTNKYKHIHIHSFNTLISGVPIKIENENMLNNSITKLNAD